MSGGVDVNYLGADATSEPVQSAYARLVALKEGRGVVERRCLDNEPGREGLCPVYAPMRAKVDEMIWTLVAASVAGVAGALFALVASTRNRLNRSADVARAAEGCKAFVEELVAWVRDNPNPGTEDRYVWFIVVHNQVRSKHVIGHMRGRLDYDESKKELSGVGWHFIRVEDKDLSRPQQELPKEFQAPGDEPLSFELAGPPGKDAKRGRLTLSVEKQLDVDGVHVKNMHCADGVIYGWEEVPEGEDAQTYARTYFVVSFNPMSAVPPVPSVQLPQVIDLLVGVFDRFRNYFNNPPGGRLSRK